MGLRSESKPPLSGTRTTPVISNSSARVGRSHPRHLWGIPRLSTVLYVSVTECGRVIKPLVKRSGVTSYRWSCKCTISTSPRLPIRVSNVGKMSCLRGFVNHTQSPTVVSPSKDTGRNSIPPPHRLHQPRIHGTAAAGKRRPRDLLVGCHYFFPWIRPLPHRASISIPTLLAFWRDLQIDSAISILQGIGKYAAHCPE